MQKRSKGFVILASFIPSLGLLALPLLSQEVPSGLERTVELAPELPGVVGAEGVETSPNSRFVFLYGGPECTDRNGGDELFRHLQKLLRSEGVGATLFARECHRVVVPRRHDPPGGIHQLLTLGLKHTARGEAQAELEQLANLAEGLASVSDSEIWDAGGAGLVLTLRRAGECGDAASEAALRDQLTAKAELAGLDVALFPRQCYRVLVPPPGPQMMQPGLLWLGTETLT